jgi:hypothetical protein
VYWYIVSLLGARPERLALVLLKRQCIEAPS